MHGSLCVELTIQKTAARPNETLSLAWEDCALGQLVKFHS